jgi:hypothetical protein
MPERFERYRGPSYFVVQDESGRTIMAERDFAEASSYAGRLARLNPGIEYSVVREPGGRIVARFRRRAVARPAGRQANG